MTEQEMISKAEAKLMSHEAVCAERYARIDTSLANGDKRMTKIEYLLYAVMACVLLGPGVAADVVKHLFKM